MQSLLSLSSWQIVSRNLPDLTKQLLLPLACLCALVISTNLHAHSSGENYVFFNIHEDRIDGMVEISVEDLKDAFDIEIDQDGDYETIMKATAPEVQAYIAANFSIGADGETYPLEFTDVEFLDLPHLDWVKYHFVMEPGRKIPQVIEINHTMLYELGRLHRGVMGVMQNVHTGIKHGDESAHMVFGPRTSMQQLDLTEVPEVLGARAMVPQGVLHIWIGIDHILFLLCLLLPTVLIRREGEIVPVEKFISVLWRVIKIVTLFTIAHSITLALAALDFIVISSRLVESIIALSIILVAVNNFVLRATSVTYVMILILGLFHGLGFASVMGNLPFRMDSALKVVIGFNIGVEIGQMVIVAFVFPLLYLLRKNSLYIPVVLKGGSIVLGVIACYWFIQRAFGLG